MSLPPFSASRALTFGVELELQIVNTGDFDLTPGAPDLLRLLERRGVVGDIKPEMTSSMIEIATGVCERVDQAQQELAYLRDALVDAARTLDLGIAGGGTHAYQQWKEQQITDAVRYQHLSSIYGYLAKQFTIFGQHVHIGAPSPDIALYLMHGLSRFIPHFIALSASSPFVQGADTGFASARLNSVFAFPLSGRAPLVQRWEDFSRYFDKMTATGVVASMKDFYWDIRPKPEYGTVEVRVMDTPLTIRHAANIAAYIQTVARWLLIERPFEIEEDDYLVYTFNRFQACRFGYAGEIVHPRSHERISIAEDIVATLDTIEQHAIELGCDQALGELRGRALGLESDASWLREQFARSRCLPDTVRHQVNYWMD